MKILIVDDSAAFLNALGAILGDMGYADVVKKESAAAAIDYLRSLSPTNKNTPVGLILMDVIMPEMNGIEAVRAIKADENLLDIPVVIVSARDDEERIEAAFEAGAIDYIGKPIKKTELCARVRSVLKLKEEMDRRKAHERELEQTVKQLRKAAAEIKTLTGLLPICAGCKKIRDDKGYWQQVEYYVAEHTDAKFTHGLCPDCLRKLYPTAAEKILSRIQKKIKEENNIGI
jgi:sigma-B regulation protein RsbU (phosphoserine phosphatase)